MSDEPRLKVKHGGKVLGPMSIVEVADLMAEGKVAESDLVSDGGPWVTFEAYVGSHAEPDVSSVTPGDVEALFAGEFAIEFDASGAAKGSAGKPAGGKSAASAASARGAPASASKALAGKPTPSKPSAPVKPPETLDEDDIVDLLEADDDEDDSDVVDLDLADDDDDRPRRPGSKSPAGGGLKGSPSKPSPANAKPVAGGSGSSAKAGDSSAKGTRSLRPMPMPPSLKGGPGKAPPPLMDDDEIDVMEFLSDDPKPATGKPAAAKPTAGGASPSKGSATSSSASKPASSASVGGVTRPTAASPSKPGVKPPSAAGKLASVPPPPAGKKEPQPINEAHSSNLPPGFRPMFNGRNFSGWEFFPIEDWTSGKADCWKVEGGIIRFDGTARRPHLLSIPEFTDFELFVGWRALKPDWQGGILLRSDSAPSGTRCFISLGAKDAGKLCGVGTSGSKAAPGIQKPAGEWNVWRIVAVGERIGLWCNQECAWSEASLNRPRGKIGLRADGSALEFKFLHVRELTKK